jgi:hypothetical protein
MECKFKRGQTVVVTSLDSRDPAPKSTLGAIGKITTAPVALSRYLVHFDRIYTYGPGESGMLGLGGIDFYFKESELSDVSCLTVVEKAVYGV